ncbi:DUF2818 family protein [Paludibacterium paludis]|uniref:Membrane protein n=1 Tax=Paludibacterium paludis TaxID=1225769 RepID=A0A918P2P6_9NEIS|nr:DUF2818 family protein [Paludibacterium paludis]GGY14354.1 membrane protein [Paludibacterium paludis]
MQASVATLLIVAVLAANLPFMTNRIAGIKKVAHKAFGWRFLEWGVLYVAVGLFARFLESRQMPVQSQEAAFYVATLSLFAVFAFPGFVIRYWWRKRGI